MSVTAGPETFSFVNYEHSAILDLAQRAASDAGLSAEAELHIEVMESSPLGRLTVDHLEAGPPLRGSFVVQGGAFENLKAPRQFDPARARETLGRLFMRVADFADPAFGYEGEFDKAPVPRQVAWDVYAVGRLRRLRYTVSHDRWLYLFRNRHAFTDESDLVFERLWSAEPLTWPEIRSLSESVKPESEMTTGRRVPAR